MKGEPVFKYYQGEQQMTHFFNKTIQDIQKGLEKYPGTLYAHSEQWLEFKNEEGQFITVVVSSGTLEIIYKYFNKIPFGSGRPNREDPISKDDINNLIIDIEQNL